MTDLSQFGSPVERTTGEYIEPIQGMSITVSGGSEDERKRVARIALGEVKKIQRERGYDDCGCLLPPKE